MYSKVRKSLNKGLKITSYLFCILIAVILSGCDPDTRVGSKSGQYYGDGSKKASWIPKYDKSSPTQQYTEPQKTEAFYKLRK